MLSSRSPDSSRSSFGSGYIYPGPVKTSPSVSRQVSSSPSSSTRPYSTVKMPSRQNKYFLPGEGIRREVITADICRYLGNDALVKPGTYEGREGFWVTAYRALTSDMIADLKADSQRWAVEQAQIDPRGAVPYRDSRTHEYRQQHGPTSSSQGQHGQPPPSAPGRSDVYGAPAPNYYDYPHHGGAGYPPQGTGPQYQASGAYGQEYPAGSNPEYQPYVTGGLYNPSSQSSTQPRTVPQYSHPGYPPGTTATAYPGPASTEGSYQPGSEAPSYPHQSHQGMPRQPPQQHNARGADPYGRGGGNYQ